MKPLFPGWIATSTPALRRWMLVVALAGTVALYVGFVYFPPASCERLVQRLGYSWMLALSLGWLAALARLIAADRVRYAALWPGNKHALIILMASLWVVRMDPFGYKILFDEPVQVSTSLSLHQDRELATVTRAYSPSGIFTVLTSYLDKRPPFFPFAVSVLHDLTGYRRINAYVVNILGTIALLGVVWHIGRRISGNALGGVLMVMLLATLPELGVTATGAGMDLFNTTWVALLTLTALLYVDRPSPQRLNMMVMTALLLGYTRYESVIYVMVAALVWLGACWSRRRWLVGWIWAVVPLALILYGWHNTVLSNSPLLWELRENQTDRFSLGYAANNLRHAGVFLFNVGRNLPNSFVLAIIGMAGALLLVGQVVRRRSILPVRVYLVIGGLALCVVGNFGLLMCYYWGELDDPIVTRLSLPLHFLLAVLAVAAWTEFMAIFPSRCTWRIPLGVIALATLVMTVPAVARHRYSAGNLMSDNFEWERRVVGRFWPQPGLIISNRSPICWHAERIPSLSFDNARRREDAVRWHLQRHSFGKILVMQRVLTAGKDAQWGIDMTQQLPDNWRLREIAVRRFGLTLTRVSELVDIGVRGDSQSADQ